MKEQNGKTKKLSVQRGDIVVSAYTTTEVKVGKFIIVSAKREPYTGVMVLKNFNTRFCSPKSFMRLDNGDYVLLSHARSIWLNDIQSVVGHLEAQLTNRVASKQESYRVCARCKEIDHARAFPPRITSIVSGGRVSPK